MHQAYLLKLAPSDGGEPSDWERFTIVDASNSMIALHSKSQNRFVSMNPWGAVHSKAGGLDALPDESEWERFRVRILIEVVSLP
jgi:hypothetical protein